MKIVTIYVSKENEKIFKEIVKFAKTVRRGVGEILIDTWKRMNKVDK